MLEYIKDLDSTTFRPDALRWFQNLAYSAHVVMIMTGHVDCQLAVASPVGFEAAPADRGMGTGCTLV
jgi:hydroxyethylthiazole kinase-like sugar kinase family protein